MEPKSRQTRFSPDLVVAAQRGDRAAITALLAIVQPDIRRYARQTCKVSDVDDAVQDALLKLYRHVGALRAAALFSAWLFEIVRRECLRLARQAGFPKLPLELVENDVRFSERPASGLMLDIAAAIESLPDHYRRIVVLRDIEELTIDEIAAALQLGREAVKARLRRARFLLREYLEEA